VKQGYRGEKGDLVDPRTQAAQAGPDDEYYRSEGGRRRAQKKTSKRKRKSLKSLKSLKSHKKRRN
jgi:hypothetical protein